MLSLRHVGIVVKDINKEINFYKRMGLKVLKRDLERGEFISAILGNNVEVKTCKLTEKLELLEYVKGHGGNHIAFTITSENDFNDFDLISEPRISPDGKLKVAFGYDPENNLTELVYELPKRYLQKQRKNEIPLSTMSIYKAEVGAGNWC
jgi:catechol 2,3-dioxygenase-like lactoylglutathione lyase family enzyme